MRAWALRPSVILALGWGVVLLHAFPGIMTMDSFEQLLEGRTWVFSDSHPPAMAALWGTVDRILPGPLGMLVIQSGMFILGLYLLLRRAMQPVHAAICSCLLLLFPPVLAPMAVIWKDCVMAGFLVLGIAAVLDDRRHVRVLGLVAFTVATAMRYTALAATLPLIVLLFEWTPGKRWLVRYALAAGVWLAVSAVALGGNKLLTDREMTFWHQSLGLADIVGILAFVDDDIPDEQLIPLLAPTEIQAQSNLHVRIRAKYRSYDFQQLISGDGQLWVVPWTTPVSPARRDAIEHAWSTLIREHPGAYLRYRLESFGETLGIYDRFWGATVILSRAQLKGMLDQTGLGHGHSRFQHRTQNLVRAVSRTRLFRPYLYALLALGLLGVALLRDRNRDVIAILVSGLFMELTTLPLNGTPDYRYSHWLVTCTCLALIMMIARRARAAREAAR